MKNGCFYKNYTKKQLYNLYMEAMCDEISDNRLGKIKDALHETVHLGQFSSDSFISLLDVLFMLPDSLLKDIESGNFASFYKTYLFHTSGIPEDYYYMSSLLGIIYIDYQNVSTIDEYKWLCEDCMLFIRDIAFLNDEKIKTSLMKANLNLGQLLLSHANTIDYNATKKEQYNLDQVQAYTTIECNLLVSFLMGIEDFSCDYSLPTKLLNNMVKKLSQMYLKWLQTI